ncbi:MAG: hypothetical protein KDB61_15055, partial [Planctomycetes bacterium]|nr:hypothetical protein [Planctomycetota bacterium]
MNPIYRPLSLLALSALVLTAGCQSSKAPADCGACCEGTQAESTAPMDAGTDVLAVAQNFSLTPAQPTEFPGLHNVFHLSENIVSGGEPHGREALETIAKMGVKTILSVDGKIPDAATAAELGMRYVHIPIQYSGIDENEWLEIAKTFREVEGPFYVHCFHGKHRGPAAAEVGRLILDGISREHALAEMYQ